MAIKRSMPKSTSCLSATEGIVSILFFESARNRGGDPYGEQILAKTEARSLKNVALFPASLLRTEVLP